MIGDIQQFISQKYPGVVLDSPVQGWWYLDQYQKGIEEYQRIKRPSAEDDRWVGACHFLLVDDITASKYFSRAIEGSVKAAHINLAHLHMFTQDQDNVLLELDKVDFESLATCDKVYYLRVRGHYREVNQSLHQALDDLETSKELAQTIPENTFLMSSLLRGVGTITARMGKINYSSECLEQSIYSTTSQRAKDAATIECSGTLSYLGYHKSAKLKLEKIKIETLEKSLLPLFYLNLGDVVLGLQDVSESQKYFHKAINHANDLGVYGEEILARLRIAHLDLSRNLPLAARSQLDQVKMMTTEIYDVLTHDFNRILLDNFEEYTTAEKSYSALEKLARAYEDMGYIQEQHYCKLHMADIKRRQGLDILPDLHALQAAGERMQNFKFLTREWMLTKDLHTIARYTHPRLAGVEPITLYHPELTKQTQLHLSFLGRRTVTLDGKPLHVPQKWCEILALLALHPDGLSSEELLTLLYGDGGSVATLKATLSKLRHVIPIESRPYRLNAEVTADFIELETLLSQGNNQAALKLYRGRLLPGSEAPGIVETRDYLDELMRQAVISSNTDDLLSAATPFADDLAVWEAFLQKLSSTDVRYPFVKTKVRRIRRDWVMPVSGED